MKLLIFPETCRRPCYLMNLRLWLLSTLVSKGFAMLPVPMQKTFGPVVGKA